MNRSNVIPRFTLFALLCCAIPAAAQSLGGIRTVNFSAQDSLVTFSIENTILSQNPIPYRWASGGGQVTILSGTENNVVVKNAITGKVLVERKIQFRPGTVNYCVYGESGLTTFAIESWRTLVNTTQSKIGVGMTTSTGKSGEFDMYGGWITGRPGGFNESDYNGILEIRTAGKSWYAVTGEYEAIFLARTDDAVEVLAPEPGGSQSDAAPLRLFSNDPSAVSPRVRVVNLMLGGRSLDIAVGPTDTPVWSGAEQVTAAREYDRGMLSWRVRATDDPSGWIVRDSMILRAGTTHTIVVTDAPGKTGIPRAFTIDRAHHPMLDMMLPQGGSIMSENAQYRLTYLPLEDDPRLLQVVGTDGEIVTTGMIRPSDRNAARKIVPAGRSRFDILQLNGPLLDSRDIDLAVGAAWRVIIAEQGTDTFALHAYDERDVQAQELVRASDHDMKTIPGSIRLVNLAADHAGLSLSIDGETDTALGDVAYRTASAPVAGHAGEALVELRAEPSGTVLDERSLAVEPKGIVTLFATGGADPIHEVRTYAAYDGRAFLRLLNLSRDRSTITMSVVVPTSGDERKVEGLAYGMLKEEVWESGVKLRVTVHPEGSADTLLRAEFDANSKRVGTVAVIGGADGEPLALVRVVDAPIDGADTVEILATAPVSDAPLGVSSAPGRSIVPNPASAWTEIRIDITKSCRGSIVLYDMNGREASVVADGAFGAGPLHVRCDLRELAAGEYIAMFRSDDGSMETIGAVAVTR